ncbi:hypothetical protein [Liquorilactobacillus mali]|uniref:hypothetical protein n=1 Tax=Liquorilactobacillus mali TaxID=1618 RepID=UPI00234FCC97|nr:hypothetical protein [Liquorilactobacillus mali]
MKKDEFDLKNEFVMPRLINVHTHTMMNPYSNKLEYLSETETTALALHNLRELFKTGIMSIRDCGCAFNRDIKITRMLNDEVYSDYGILSPLIVPSGRPMCITGGQVIQILLKE